MKIPLRLFDMYWEIYDKFSNSKMFICSRIRLFWYRLWIRKDEFHISLDIDIEAMLTMNEEQKDDYLKDLARRRSLAHQKNF